MTIRILDPTVAAQIAAGEVVERPASVARELIENALDAGARRITVEVRGGGLRELRIQDDGSGIASNEIELAFARHATSKLTAADDLWSIGTLGFRGEALPSIASVAQVICASRTEASDVGVELRIAGGEVQGRTPTGGPIGTSISVRNLFYNTPVRREFLRSEASEASAVAATVTQYALAYPEVRFTLILEGRTAFQTSGANDLRAVLVELYGLDVARQLLPVEMRQGQDHDELAITGLISPPGVTRSSRSAMHLFVNRRVVLPRGALAAVIEEAYQSLLPKGRHPVVVLNIGMASRVVDVNIHPTKSEVKFRDAPRVFSLLGRAIRDALVASGAQLWGEDWPQNEAMQVAQRRFELRRVGDWQQRHESSGTASQDEPAAWPAAGQWRPAPVGQEAASALLPRAPTRMPSVVRTLGATSDGYIIADTDNGMLIIDRQTASERIAYEQLEQQYQAGALASRELAAPCTTERDPVLQERILAQREALTRLGFSVEAFGQAVRVRSVPEALGEPRVVAAVVELANMLSLQPSAPLERQRQALVVLASEIAHSYEAMPDEEQFVHILGECRLPCVSPRGRATMLLLEGGMLSRLFGGNIA